MDEEFLSNPYPAFSALRAAGPVHRMLLPSGLRVWAVVSHEAARVAMTHPALSKDIDTSVRLGYFDREMSAGGTPRLEHSSVGRHMLNMDPPGHTRLRKLVNKALTAKAVERLRPRIEEISAELLDAVEKAAADSADGTVDLVEHYTAVFPVRVLGELLGITDEHLPVLVDLTAAIMSDDNENAGANMARFGEHIGRMIHEKRAAPGEDLISALVTARDEEDRLSDIELVSTVFLLVVAGYETTVNMIGHGLRALLAHPEQLAELRADPSLIPAANEEFLRYEGPGNRATLRFATEPLDLGGVRVEAGEYVSVLLGSANRDEAKFVCPHQLDVKRSTNGHLGFGHGIHYCVGAPLARAEMEIALRGLLTRFPDLSLAVPDAELRWRKSFMMQGLERLPVRLSAAAAE
ncbi:cytochrome P450 family protein [Streptomyces bambusae]|uniref:Cytochrome P450 n=1 Tax=Streptomyces bambusae TaxID=1550616 RepID=A0ABS6ZCU1_9ACTN|nr:cytochrome P450 [Streptomyces bambusae]MBW5484551.1 cytochrome P450 [Streptomyces bambusae]